MFAGAHVFWHFQKQDIFICLSVWYHTSALGAVTMIDSQKLLKATKLEWKHSVQSGLISTKWKSIWIA